MMTPEDLLQLFTDTRDRSEYICSFLQTEDYVVQPVVDVSPPKWHLGHTTWFLEEFILINNDPDYRLFDKRFRYIFNSYFESLGAKVTRNQRGNLSRPTVADVYDYRKYVTGKLQSLLQNSDSEGLQRSILQAIHHEKQHQELLITDIKYILGTNPLFPKYNDEFEENPVQDFPQEWVQVEEGLYEIGHRDGSAFCFDNELGVHKVFLQQFDISNRLVTNREYLEFIEDGGYGQVLLWHSEGWEWKNQNEVRAPLYWHKFNGEWHQYTLQGLVALPLDAPVAHVSFYEAFAFANWKGMRLPTEFEWEVAESQVKTGTRWEWTESAHLPYPGYKKPGGALGEYNSKFMVNQKVLRGSSVASPPQHIRPTYRNFFQPPLRWQFTGLRLVK